MLAATSASPDFRDADLISTNVAALATRCTLAKGAAASPLRTGTSRMHESGGDAIGGNRRAVGGRHSSVMRSARLILEAGACASCSWRCRA